MNDTKKFTLTAKGWLCAQLDFNASKTDIIWDGLTKFVKENAASNGMTEGVPCLALEGGGHCITAQSNK